VAPDFPLFVIELGLAEAFGVDEGVMTGLAAAPATLPGIAAAVGSEFDPFDTAADGLTFGPELQ